jgi:hypothetical protein
MYSSEKVKGTPPINPVDTIPGWKNTIEQDKDNFFFVRSTKLAGSK